MREDLPSGGRWTGLAGDFLVDTTIPSLEEREHDAAEAIAKAILNLQPLQKIIVERHDSADGKSFTVRFISPSA